MTTCMDESSALGLQLCLKKERYIPRSNFLSHSGVCVVSSCTITPGHVHVSSNSCDYVYLFGGVFHAGNFKKYTILLTADWANHKGLVASEGALPLVKKACLLSRGSSDN